MIRIYHYFSIFKYQGPGFVHALAGMSNANENAWPLIVVGGSSDAIHESHGAFQEFPQV